jgi:hypothetical protein
MAWAISILQRRRQRQVSLALSSNCYPFNCYLVLVLIVILLIVSFIILTYYAFRSTNFVAHNKLCVNMQYAKYIHL